MRDGVRRQPPVSDLPRRDFARGQVEAEKVQDIGLRPGGRVRPTAGVCPNTLAADPQRFVAASSTDGACVDAIRTADFGRRGGRVSGDVRWWVDKKRNLECL